MIKDILQLVQNNNRVILPNFGAFIISKENGFSVLFNNFLSFNDGLLVNHIAQSQHIDATAALEKVNEYVASIKSTLDQTGKYEIPGLGRFTKDANGILRFIQDSDMLVNGSEKKQNPENELLDIVPASEGSEAPIIEETSTPVDSRLESKEPLLSIDNETEKKEPEKTQPPTTPIPPKPKTPPSQPVVEVKKEKKKSPLLLIILLIIVCGLIYFFGWVHPIDFKNFSLFKKKAADTTLVAPPPPPVKKVETPEPAPVQEVVSDKKFHIIVATLKTESLANERVAKLKEKGFDNAMVLPRSGKYLVSIDAENDLISADARQEEIVNKYRIESYVLTIK